MALTGDIKQLVTFLELDEDWVEHVMNEHYNCGCDAHGRWCEMWQSTVGLEQAQKEHAKAQQRYDNAHQNHGQPKG